VDAKNIVIVGGGFISSECTAHFAKTFKGQKQVHMICNSNVPVEKVFGFEVGDMLLDQH